MPDIANVTNPLWWNVGKALEGVVFFGGLALYAGIIGYVSWLALATVWRESRK